MSPSPFEFLRALAEPPPADAAPFVIGAMATPSHLRFAHRLMASCAALRLPLALFEVPYIHRSISPRGSIDPQYTKSSFIRFLLQRYDRPVLYLDADCVIARSPAFVDGLLRDRVDFAIFNWLAEEHTEAYFPVPMQVDGPGGPRLAERRFWAYRHSIDTMSDSQLLCSGPVQWYANTAAARQLLGHWQRTIELAPGSADDKALDLAFNNYPSTDPLLRVMWLDKSHARYAWWIHVEPVIDHPELPHSGEGFEPLETLAGMRRIDLSKVWEPHVDYIFPRDCLVDTEARRLLRRVDGRWHAVAEVTVPLWL